MTITVYRVNFEDIIEVWSKKLWPNRASPIKPMSSMIYQGGYDLDIYKKYNPSFFAVLDKENNVIGVNSGHRTSSLYYRTRGLWIDPTERLKGLTYKLFDELEKQAKLEDCKFIWSIPRMAALSAYKRNGFRQTSNFFDEGVEFGPNCYVIKDLSDFK